MPKNKRKPGRPKYVKGATWWDVLAGKPVTRDDLARAGERKDIMTERDLLFRAVLSNPADDTPRLVLADWLDEFGSARDRARAELIRLQCEVLDASTPRPRVEAILRKWAAGWLPPAGRAAARNGIGVAMNSVAVGVSPIGLRPTVYSFRRGFVDQVEILAASSADVWCGHGRGDLFVRQFFAANPASRVVLACVGYEPEVAIEVVRRDDGWQARLSAVTGEPLTQSATFAHRRELLAWLPGFTRHSLSNTVFEVADTPDHMRDDAPEHLEDDYPDDSYLEDIERALRNL